MKKFLVWPNGVKNLGIPPGDKVELSPLTFAEFDKLNKWSGTNDVAYSQFLRHNNFREIEEDAWHPLSEEALRAAVFVIEDGEPCIDWSVTYGEITVVEAIL